MNIQDERDLLTKPGDTILEVIEDLKMTQAELAERMGKTPPKVNDIISGKEPITVATAIILEKVLNIESQFWLNLEAQYRDKLTRIEQEEFLVNCKSWLEIQPINELKKCGYLKGDKKDTSLVNECLQFYGVATPTQWESLYVNEYFTASFRKSQVHQSSLGSIAAWFRIGEIEMRRLKLKPYNKDTFKTNLLLIKELVRIQPEDYAYQLQSLCLDAGVALIYTMCISKAPISGATRWIGGTPLIQLTDRYKSNDHFWFTFYHEAGHIFLHGRKEVFIEEFTGYDNDKQKEFEADEFANKWLLPEKFMDELPNKITEKVIKDIARKYETHPAIVLARLQYKKFVPYSFGINLKLKVILDYMFNQKQNDIL